MRVAYLVNRYPHVSHSFIRREIAGAERAGVEVLRFSLRPAGGEVVDPADAAEAKVTRSVLGAGWPAIFAATLAVAVGSPGRFFRALRAALAMGAAGRSRLRHLAYLAEACLLRRWLRDARADHLHAHFGTNPAAVARLTFLLGGPPFSFTVHGPEEFDRPEALSLRAKGADAAFVVAVSSFGRGQLFRWLRPDDWPKVRVVRCGVDAQFLADGPQPPRDAPRLVCVGRLAEQKGQLLLVEAAALAARRGREFQLVLAGDGPMRAEVEEAARAAGVAGRVRVTGWLSGGQVRDEMLAARAVVLPSFAEGLPVVLMEALALGRPVVTTFVAGIPELVRGGESGWLVPSGDAARLADALVAALDATVEALAEMGRAGAAAVAAAHDASVEGAKLAELFREHAKSATLPHGGALARAPR